MAHGHDRFDRAMFRDVVQNRVEERNQRGDAFEMFGDPAPPLELRKVHEFGADGAAIDAARRYGRFSGQPLQVGLREWAKESKRIKIGFVVAPTAKRVKDALALL